MFGTDAACVPRSKKLHFTQSKPFPYASGAVRSMPMIRAVAKYVVDSCMPSVGQAYRSLRNERAALAPAMTTPFGFELAGNASMASGFFEKNEIHAFLTQLQRASVCIDIGANIGLYTCLAASRGKHVVAIEPMPSNLKLLCRNLVRNDFNDVEVFPLGLSSTGGITRIFGDGTAASLLQGWAGASEKFYTIVPVTTLDLIVNTRFDGLPLLIKLDVEGFEGEVLKGAKRTLGLDPKPTWLVEICLNEHFPGGLNGRFYETFEVFWRCGYHATTADEEQRLLQPDLISRWVEQGFVDFGSHNYLFS
jgi:FkbM family methyltransferase